jgi:hypothetical protein
MTLPSTDGTVATPTPAGGPVPTRVIVVVPRREPGVHEYLRRALESVKGVEVVLDRRAVAATPPADRRRSTAENAERKLLICSLVHCPIEPPAPPAPPTVEEAHHTGHRRTLLWPDLRLEHL